MAPGRGRVSEACDRPGRSSTDVASFGGKGASGMTLARRCRRSHLR